MGPGPVGDVSPPTSEKHEVVPPNINYIHTHDLPVIPLCLFSE